MTASEPASQATSEVDNKANSNATICTASGQQHKKQAYKQTGTKRTTNHKRLHPSCTIVQATTRYHLLHAGTARHARGA